MQMHASFLYPLASLSFQTSIYVFQILYSLPKTSVSSNTGLCVSWGTSWWAALCYFCSPICLEHRALPWRNPHHVAMVAAPVLFLLISKIRSDHTSISKGYFQWRRVCVHSGEDKCGKTYVWQSNGVKLWKSCNNELKACSDTSKFKEMLQNIPFEI